MNQTVYLGAAELLILSFALGVGVLLLVRRFSLPARIASLRTGSMGTISGWISVSKIVSVGIGPLAILLLFVGLSSGPIAEWPQQINSRTEQKLSLIHISEPTRRS